MPVVPQFQAEDLPQIMQTGPQQDMAAAGISGEAAARLGQAGVDYAAKMIDAVNYDWTSNAISNFAKNHQDALEAAQKQATKTGDFLGAAQAFNANLANDQAAAIAGAPTPRAADAFKRHSTGLMDEFTRQMNGFAQKGDYSKWNSNSQQANDTDATTAYRNPAMADQLYGIGLGRINGAQAAGIGGADVDWQARRDAWGKQLYGAVVRNQIDNDPKAAITALQSGKFDFALHAEDVENYTHMAQVASDRQDQKALVAQERALAAEQRQDMMAQRALRQTQATNEAQLLGATLKGQNVDPGQLADLVRSQQITPEGYNAIVHGQEGRDDPAATLHMYQQLGTGDLKPADITAAVASRQIKMTTGVELMRGINERDKTGDNQVERSAFSTLKTALDGQAVESGGIQLFGNQANRAQSSALWSQAQGEWNRRVNIGHEDPNAVLSDMMPRYSPKANLPTWLPQPTIGTITAKEDVPVLLQQLNAAKAAGTMSPDQLQSQAQLVKLYADFFDAKDRRDAAAKSVRPGAKAPAPSSAAPPILTPAATDDDGGASAGGP